MQVRGPPPDDRTEHRAEREVLRLDQADLQVAGAGSGRDLTTEETGPDYEQACAGSQDGGERRRVVAGAQGPRLLAGTGVRPGAGPGAGRQDQRVVAHLPAVRQVDLSSGSVQGGGRDAEQPGRLKVVGDGEVEAAR